MAWPIQRRGEIRYEGGVRSSESAISRDDLVDGVKGSGGVTQGEAVFGLVVQRRCKSRALKGRVGLGECAVVGDGLLDGGQGSGAVADLGAKLGLVIQQSGQIGGEGGRVGLGEGAVVA